MKAVSVLGAGLAGSEAAFQLAERGIKVDLYEMRPEVMTKAHQTGSCAELVCSNSLKGEGLDNAVGLLKAELRKFGSLILAVADAVKVPAGAALAVDRTQFSAGVDRVIRNHPNITMHPGEVRDLPVFDSLHPVIVATGPLTTPALAAALAARTGHKALSFFDAISPIVTDESLDHSVLYRKSRYDKGGDDYLNVPLSKDVYETFVAAVSAGEKYEAHAAVEEDAPELRPFEACMPIEEMVARGTENLRYGPLKPVGLRDPATGKTPYAVIQLRQDNQACTLWSMVGFQTRLKHPEQLRIFRALPGFAEAEFVRLGTVHRNTFIDSPQCLNSDFGLRNCPGLFCAGQITGTEGYVESTMGGMIAALGAYRLLTGEGGVAFPKDTAIGSLSGYVTDPTRTGFQPMNMSFGIMESYTDPTVDRSLKRDKKAWRRQVSDRALQSIDQFMAALGDWATTRPQPAYARTGDNGVLSVSAAG